MVSFKFWDYDSLIQPPPKKKNNDKFRECSFPTSASRSESSGLVVFAKEFPRCVWLVFKRLCKILTPFLFGGARVLFVQLQQNWVSVLEVIGGLD